LSTDKLYTGIPHLLITSVKINISGAVLNPCGINDLIANHLADEQLVNYWYHLSSEGISMVLISIASN
jgi:hypothetical protein